MSEPQSPGARLHMAAAAILKMYGPATEYGYPAFDAWRGLEIALAASACLSEPAADPRIEELQHDVIALRGALGEAIPCGHNGRLSDGTIPRNAICASALRAVVDDLRRGAKCESEYIALTLRAYADWFERRIPRASLPA